MNIREREDGAPWRNFYGRRRGKKLRPGQAALVARLSELAPPGLGHDENPERRPLDLARLYPGKAVWLEIGFGGGEHMLAQARANPEVQIIGASQPERRHDLELMRTLIHRHTQRLARYRCESCGFKARQFYWRCPACGGWETYPPRRTEEFDLTP